jgi:hypothetical protein
MRKLLVLAVACGLASPAPAFADTYSYFYYSLEWLVDASDSIVEATVVPSPYKGNPNQSTATVKSLGRVFKQVGKAGPVEGAVLPTHVARGDEHRVLLFTRPAEKRPGERVVYCVYLTADATPEGKKGDPFAVLPCHSSAWERLAFSAPTCVAIDRTGKVLTDPDAVVRLVEARVKSDPTRVSADGRYVKCGPTVDDGDDHNLLVPGAPKAK